MGGHGAGITMGHGAKAVSNVLMEAVAGRNMSMTNRHTHARECKPQSHSERSLKTTEETNWGGGEVRRGILRGISWR